MTLNLNSPPESYALPAAWQKPEQDDYLTQQVWDLVLRGESDPNEYLEYFEDELEDAGISEPAATEFFTSVIELRRAQQQSWGEFPQTALSKAFDALAEIGIVARQNFACCGSCGSAEIGDERDESRQWRGYIYFHQQDTDQIFESNTTYVGYGLFLDSYFTDEQWEKLSEAEQAQTYEKLTVELMDNEVIPVLEKHGIAVDWNRDLGTRILLENAEYVVQI